MPALYAESVMPLLSHILSRLLQLQRAGQCGGSQGSASSPSEGFGTFGNALGSTACLVHTLVQHCMQPHPQLQQPLGDALPAFAAGSTEAAAATAVDKATTAGQVCALF